MSLILFLEVQDASLWTRSEWFSPYPFKQFCEVGRRLIGKMKESNFWRARDSLLSGSRIINFREVAAPMDLQSDIVKCKKKKKYIFESVFLNEIQSLNF